MTKKNPKRICIEKFIVPKEFVLKPVLQTMVWGLV